MSGRSAAEATELSVVSFRLVIAVSQTFNDESECGCLDLFFIFFVDFVEDQQHAAGCE